MTQGTGKSLTVATFAGSIDICCTSDMAQEHCNLPEVTLLLMQARSVDGLPGLSCLGVGLWKQCVSQAEDSVVET